MFTVYLLQGEGIETGNTLSIKVGERTPSSWSDESVKLVS